MTTNPVGWFEIPVTVMPRAIKYYETVFNLKLVPPSEETGPVIMAFFPFTSGLPGASGALVKASGYNPSSAGSLVYFSVQSIESTIKTVTDLGCRVLKPKTSIGPHGFIAFIEDHDGNRIGIHCKS